jgi:DNA-binding LytR/AlgR family response regulator
MYRFLMIEDEPDMAANLRSHLDRYAKAHGLEFDVTWLKTAFEFIGSKQPYDLIFMDIGLPGIDGMEAAQLLRAYDEDTLVIFVTNLAQYAVNGYEVGALDFLLKPVSYHAFSMRLDRALRILDRKGEGNVCITTKQGAHVIPYASLVYVEVHGHDLEFHLEDRTLELRGSLAKLEEELEEGRFVRVSNSHLVNLDHIRSVDGPTMTMSNGDEVTISRTRRKETLEALTDYYGSSR